MMRIITGKARGVRLNTLEGEHTRPTSERTKEAVFSTLQFDLLGAKVLDLFAGSGQLGLEAVSRGAAYAVLCDASGDAVRIIRSNVEKTRLGEQCRIVCRDFFAFLKSGPHPDAYDLIFLDPPYAQKNIPVALKLLLEQGLLAKNAKIVCEAAAPEDVFGEQAALADAFKILKTAKYGIAYVTILQYDGEGKGA